MLNRLLVVMVDLVCASFTFPANSLAQTSSSPAKNWPDTDPTRTISENRDTRVPVRDISGLWGSDAGSLPSNPPTS
jgi:hypothetical protein